MVAIIKPCVLSWSSPCALPKKSDRSLLSTHLY